MKIITTNEKIQPVIEHIQTMQEQIKNLEAELKQYKLLLQTDMGDAIKVEAMNGRTLAQIISQTRENFQAALLKADDFETYAKYTKTIEISYLKVS